MVNKLLRMKSNRKQQHTYRQVHSTVKLTIQRGVTDTARHSENITCHGVTGSARHAARSHSFDYISTT
jgi:hypothetical protein